MMRKVAVVLLAAGLMAAGCGRKPSAKAAAAVDPMEAINSGVAFLVGAQNEDGSYGQVHPGVGITALAAIAIATAPRQLSAEEQQTLDRAVEYILPFAQPDGSIHNTGMGYEHYRTSLAVMALSVIDQERYREQVANARMYLIGSQFNETEGNFTEKDYQFGGWRYGKQEGEANPDLSNTQMVLDALEASGLPKDSQTFQDAVKFLQRCQSRTESNDMPDIGDDGGGIYSPVASKADKIELPNGKTVYRSYGSMTYALLKSYIFCNLPKDDPRMQAAYKWVQEHYTVDENPNLGAQGLYYYYLTMARALQAYGDPILKTPDGVEHRWAEELAAKLVSLQNPEGFWVNPQDRWYEGDKAMVTGYAVWTLNICNDMMKK